MAEFKLGRIRFIWKDAWVTGTTYYKDDVIRYGGRTYICVIGHTASAEFATDLYAPEPVWQQMSDGQDWKNDWSTSTVYKTNDVVKYGGYLYICNTDHTSAADTTLGLEADQEKWDLFIEGFDYKADWATSTRYKINDIVKYGALVYLCTQEHTSAADTADGLELDQDKWDIFTEGTDWKDIWTPVTRYRVGDTVRYGGTLYVCNEGHTSAADDATGLEADQTKWDYVHKGIEYLGNWSKNTRYKINDVVKDSGSLWICTTYHTSGSGRTLEADETNWAVFVPGLEFEDTWKADIAYQPGDVVTYGGYSYIAQTNHQGIFPTTIPTYVNPIHTATTTAGTGFDFTVTKSNGKYQVTINDAGADYAPGDTFEINGTILGGLSVDNDLLITVLTVGSGGEILTIDAAGNSINDWDLFTTGFNLRGDYADDSTNQDYRTGDVVRLGGFTYLAIADNNNVRPPNTDYWEKLNSGAFWKDAWVDGSYYDQGDVVIHGVNSYICVLEHTADENPLAGNNRPDQDVNGTYWNLVAAGAESGSLTTTGDIVYYSASGPTRLPVGRPGQVLNVNADGNAPQWSYFGFANHIYYVEAENGLDIPAPNRGVTLDLPWKTVRYACEQIEKGSAYANAKRLLEINRNFIAAEIVEWTDYQIANNNAPFTTGFTYDKAICQRDMGFLVDALVWDISHGGNVRSREAALAYFTELGASYIAGQEDETVASIEYGLTVIDAVLTQIPPAANYQTINSVANPVTQQFDADFIEEDDAFGICQTLVAIVTDAITAGDTTGIPAKRVANKTIFVKTGEYKEVLPIRVPEQVAIVGDELRSTRIEPAGPLVDSTDTPYSLESITHLQSIVSDIITNTSVTPQTGNTTSQVTTRPAGDAAAGTAAADLFQQIYDYIDYSVNGATGDSTVPSMTGSNTPVADQNIYNAVEVLEANKDFLVADVLAYIQANYPLYAYDQDKCARDVGLILDAVAYDVAFGTNYNSVVAGLAYRRANSSEVYGAQLTQTVGGITFLKQEIQALGFAPAAQTRADAAFDEILDILQNDVAAADALTFPTPTAGTQDQVDAKDQLQANRAFMVAEVIQYITDNYPALVYDQAKCERDTGYIVDALSYDILYGGNSATLTAARAYFEGTASQLGAGQETATAAAYNYLQTIAQQIVQGTDVAELQVGVAQDFTSGNATATEATIIADLIQYIEDVITAGSLDPLPASEFPDISAESQDYIDANESILAAKPTLQVTTLDYVNSTYSVGYDKAACSRDVREYIDAIKYDLIYPGNYKSLMAARMYANAVEGSATEDMFYLRNATGLRNCTLRGLDGSLGAANAYGTQRPSAGAYASLDPGWGPNDERVWIQTRSPYCQNVSTFGNGCVGLKVDGDLHAGGNDSIVANDFTQILSDGIGAWVTNLGRAELVSVFTYYNHIGYLSENGGKIRGTNGNNSYGDYGSVAEGIDNTETPVLGEVDNRQLEAQIGAVYTDGANEILQLEYLNAGQGYNDSTTGIIAVQNIGPGDSDRTEGTYQGVVGTSSGSGTGQEFTVTVTDVGSIEVEVTKGGSGHSIGDTITVQASDIGGTGTNTSFEVGNIGLTTRYTISGDGFGAQVNQPTIRDGGVYEVRLLETTTDPESDFGGFGYKSIANAAQQGNATQITLSATDVEPSGTYNGMAIYITSGLGAGQYAYIDTFDAASKIATVKRMSDDGNGWDHATGAAIQPVLDATTQYIIEPRVIFSPPASGITATGRARVADERVVEIRIIEPGSGYTSAPTLTLVDPNNTLDVPHEVRIGDGVLGQPSWTDRGTGYITSQASVVGDGYADIFQYGTKIRVDGLTQIPQAGSNVEFASIPNTWYKLVTITNLTGRGPYSALLQVSPAIEAGQAMPHTDAITIRNRFSQVRLTGHDFLDIGTGNFEETNYPGLPQNEPDPSKETNDYGGGRVFYTSTDQDGNFRVGGLFNVEQATGIATLNVEAFNISGLNELQLGSVALGGTGAVINEFSTDGTFAADSDSIVPTQKAIKTYITSQIGGGVATLNVNSVTAGLIEISGREINTSDDSTISINNTVNFKGGIDGAPVALQLFLLN